jgi:hypothetical protein
MLKLPEEFSKQISVFAPLFRKKVFEHAKVLVAGALLVIGRRTVCSSLSAAGRGQEMRWHKYHRVLSRAQWCARRAGQYLLRALLDRFASEDEALVFGIDETIERRRGAKIRAKGVYRDPVRSSKSHFVKCSGLRWVSLMWLAPISWTGRVWALPFLTVLAPSERFAAEQQRPHKKLNDWARQMLLQLRRWLPQRRIYVVADASYAVLELLDAVRAHVHLITRLRLDAALYEPIPQRKPGQVGRLRKKGARLPTLQVVLCDPATQWTTIHLPAWYSKGPQTALLTSGTAWWYHSGKPAVPIRWVLLKSVDGSFETSCLLSTDEALDPVQIVSYFMRRWTMEVTFQEVRAHLGVESQRQWSDQAIARTTPVLMAMFSVVALWADTLNQRGQLRLDPKPWYPKVKPTFADAIASVRYRIWDEQHLSMSYYKPEVHNLKPPWLKQLILMATRAA